MSRPALVTVVIASAVALAMRLHNTLTYPPDWGFDASFNWRYIAHLTRTWTLPALDAGWSASDPPLYFYLCALLMRALPRWIVLVPLLNAVLGLVLAAQAALLLRRAAPGDTTRMALGVGLVLYLPAHVHMSAMVNEEMLASVLIAAALLAVARRDDEPPATSPREAALAGLAAGAALLTKLTGTLALATVVATQTLQGLRSRGLRRAVVAVGISLGLAAAVGGWHHLRNVWGHGSLQPVGMPAHTLMFDMPPGERGPLDFVRFPLSTFTDPQLLNPDLLVSVWGSTYASVWYDAHRFFLPTESDAVSRLGTLTLLLALLPTAAFLVGLQRGARRWLSGRGALDLPLLLLTAGTLAGYAYYAWRNPWFATLKGTSLLALTLPYATYASEVLLDWARRGRWPARAIGGALAALGVCVVLSGTFDLVFERTEVSGLPWKESAP